MSVRSAPYFGPAGKTPNELASQASAAAAGVETFSAVQAHERAALERLAVIEADRRGIVARCFAEHVEQLRAAAPSPAFIGAGVGAVGGGVWCGAKWDGKEAMDLLMKVGLGVVLGATGGGVLGALYERLSGPPMPRVSWMMPPQVRDRMKTLAMMEALIRGGFEVLSAADVPAWRVAAWEEVWAELAAQYAQARPGAITINPAALLPQAVRGVVAVKQ